MSELKRHLGLFQLTIYGVGLILGAGIYVLIGEATAVSANTVWLAFVLATIVSIFTGLSYAELSSMHPKAAAEFVYVKKAFKNNFLAFIVGWMALFTAIISTTTVALGFGSYFSGFFQIPVILTAGILVVILSLVNFFGIKESSWMNVTFTLIEAAGLTFVIVLGFLFGGNDQVNYFESPFGIYGIFAAFGLVFFAYIGFENIVNVSEETKNPRKTIPKAIIFSILITGIIYVLVSLASLQILSWEELGASKAPIADIAGKMLGASGYTILSIIALFAITNTVLILSISGSRIMYGISNEDSLPKFFSKIYHKTKTPWIAIFSCMIISIMFLFVGDIATVANITVFTITIIFAMVNLSVIWLRIKEPDFERPFKIPFSIKNIPILPVFGLITSAVATSFFNWYVISMGLIVVVSGIIFYFMFEKLRQKSTSF